MHGGRMGLRFRTDGLVKLPAMRKMPAQQDQLRIVKNFCMRSNKTLPPAIFDQRYFKIRVACKLLMRFFLTHFLQIVNKWVRKKKVVYLQSPSL